MARNRRDVVLRLVLLAVPPLLTLAVFRPALTNQFLRYDDTRYVVRNTRFIGLEREQLHTMFTEMLRGYYEPLTWLSYSLDRYASGLTARGVHRTSLMLHAINTALVYLLAVRLLGGGVRGAPPPSGSLRLAAAVAALFFGVHPLRVEGVAWASGRAYPLAGLFGLLAVLCYVRAARMQAGWARRGWIGACLVAYCGSLLSVPQAVGLPIIFLVLDIYVLRRLGAAGTRDPTTSRHGVWLEKLPFLVILLGVSLATPLARAREGRLTQDYPMPDRLASAAYSTAFGLCKTVWPAGLSPLYENPPQMIPAAPVYLASGLLLVAVTVGTFAIRRRWSGAWAAWLAYIILFLPVSGLVKYGLQLTADRYTYIAGIPFAILLGGLAHAGWRGRHALGRLASGTGAALTLLVLAWLAHRQTFVWSDTVTLFQYVLAHNPNSRIALSNLGVECQGRGQTAEAEAYYRRALRVDPGDYVAHSNLGFLTASSWRLEEATQHYAFLVEIGHRPQETRRQLAVVLARRGLIEQAMLAYRPLLATAEPAVAYRALPPVLMAEGYDEAAAQVLRAGLKQLPDDPVMLNNLAWLLATSFRTELRNGAEAVQLAQRSLATSSAPVNPGLLDTLAAAYAEAGEFPKAVATAERAVEIAREAGQEALADEITARLEGYRNKVAYQAVQPPPAILKLP